MGRSSRGWQSELPPAQPATHSVLVSTCGMLAGDKPLTRRARATRRAAELLADQYRRQFPRSPDIVTAAAPGHQASGTVDKNES